MKVTYEYDGHRYERIPNKVRTSLAVAWVQQWAQKQHPRDQVTVTLNKRKGTAASDALSNDS
jgi:hypothetical protein